MKIYHYNPTTGEYLGEGVADASPLEADNWLIPDHATTIAPPAAQTGKARVFNGEKWSHIADLRGAEYWLADGTHHTITELGTSKPEGALDTPPPPSNDDLVSALRVQRDQLLRNSDPRVLPDYPHANEAARQAWQDYRQALRDLPANNTDPANPVWPVLPEDQYWSAS